MPAVSRWRWPRRSGAPGITPTSITDQRQGPSRDVRCRPHDHADRSRGRRRRPRHRRGHFQQHAEGAKKGCVVSRALAGVKTSRSRRRCVRPTPGGLEQSPDANGARSPDPLERARGTRAQAASSRRSAIRSDFDDARTAAARPHTARQPARRVSHRPFEAAVARPRGRDGAAQLARTRGTCRSCSSMAIPRKSRS